MHYAFWRHLASQNIVPISLGRCSRKGFQVFGDYLLFACARSPCWLFFAGLIPGTNGGAHRGVLMVRRAKSYQKHRCANVKTGLLQLDAVENGVSTIIRPFCGGNSWRCILQHCDLLCAGFTQKVSQPYFCQIRAISR